MTVLLSIVIPAYNEEKLLPATLAGLEHSLKANADPGLTWEIVVCDNNSTDGTAAAAAARGARLVFEPVNQISRARNAGARNARGKWLLFMDADTHPPPELMAEVGKLIRSGDVVGCGATLAVEGGTQLSKLLLERLNLLFRVFRLCGGAFLLCQAEAFRVLGGFSTDLYAYEEVDFVRRLKRFGRQRGRTFPILHRNPVITSGRKGEYSVCSLVTMVGSNFVAVILFGLHYVLPRGWLEKLGSRMLGYWYDGRR